MLNYVLFFIILASLEVLSKDIPSLKSDQDESAEASQLYSQSLGLGFGQGFNPGFNSFGLGGGMFGNGNTYVNKKDFDTENKKAQEQDFQKIYGAKGENSGFGNQGFNEGLTAVKNNKADSGFFNSEAAANQQSGDNKEFYGQKHTNEEGKSGEQTNANRGYKKGHSTKGFKTSARKDEEEKSESFYDEAHDEAEDKHIKGEVGSYGQKEASNFKGGQDQKNYNNVEKGEQGKFEKANVLDANKGEKGQFQQQAQQNSNAAFGSSTGVGAQSVLGHQEASGGEKYYGSGGVLPFFGGH